VHLEPALCRAFGQRAERKMAEVTDLPLRVGRQAVPAPIYSAVRVSRVPRDTRTAL